MYSIKFLWIANSFKILSVDFSEKNIWQDSLKYLSTTDNCLVQIIPELFKYSSKNIGLEEFLDL